MAFVGMVTFGVASYATVEPAFAEAAPESASTNLEVLGVGGCSTSTLAEGFNDITTLAGSGWSRQNLSAPLGSTSWFQGTPVAGGGPFDAQAGAANAYIGANYNNTTSGSNGTISNWLIAPERTLRNGDTMTFYTRKATPDTYPDRLEVRMSTNGASTNVGASATSVGDFSTLVLSINPTLVTGAYPTTWTQYTVTISGLPAPTQGRLAFRYFVTNAGDLATNSDYIGIDTFQYNNLCIPLQADLSITKTDGVATATAGGSVTYTITASNAGVSNVIGATVADTFPAILTGTWTCIGAGSATCTASGAGNINDTVDLPVGGSVTYTMTAAVSPAATGTLSNTATVTVPADMIDPNGANNSATDSDTLAQQANLAITKTDGVTTATQGGSVTYTITASNAGPSSVVGATVADTFPASLTATWTCVGTGGGTCTAAGAGNINDTVNLPSGGSVTYTAAATVSPAASGTLSNTATVTAPAGVNDPTPGNNSATDSDTLLPTTDLSITKTDNETNVLPGQSLTYTIVASNAGPTAVTGATVTDTFPAALLNAQWTCAATGGATCTAGPNAGNINDTVNLPVGSTVTYTVTADVSAAAPSGPLANTATITAPATVFDSNNANNSATDTDTIGNDLIVTKSNGVTSYTAGGTTTYTIVVTNFAGATNTVTVTDNLPAGISSATWTCTGSGGATCTAGPVAGNINTTATLPAGTSVTYTLNANIAAGATGNLTNTVTVSGTLPESDLSNNTASDTDAPASSPSCLGNLATYTQSTPVAIPTGPAVVTSTLVVAGAGPYLLDANAITNITHTFSADLDITITSPAGTVVTLTTDNGAGNDDVFNGTRWDDDANPGGQVPYTTNAGLAADNPYVNLSPALALVPEEPMGAFIGENPNGTWTITISDDLAGDGGSLNSWAMELTTIANAPNFAAATYTNTTPIAIPTGPAVVTSAIVVSGAGTSISDVNAQTFLQHTFAADLDITITSPAGTVVTLTTDNGAGNDNVFNGTIWDDDANPGGQVPYTTNSGMVTDNAYVNLTTATPLTPEEALAAFIGENPNGTWTITISDDLAGDGGSLDSWNLTVQTSSCQFNTATTITSSADPSVFGQPVTFTATVATVPAGVTPTGTVQFVVDGSNAGAPVALNGSGVATFTTSTLAVGNHTVTANYISNSPNFNTSSGSLATNPQTVNAASTTTTVASSVNPSAFGQGVTFTATVAPVAPGAGAPSGTIQFFDGAAPIGAPVTVAGGTAQLTTSSLAVGSHTITAVFTPNNGNFAASTSAPVVQLVNPAATTTTVVSSTNPTVFGQPVTFTATVAPVAPGAGSPSGTVQFFDGATPLGAPVAVAGGTAQLTTSSLAVGNHTITAVFTPNNGNFNASTSAPVVQVVNKANTTTTVASSVNPSNYGQNVVFTATIAAVAPGGGTPAGGTVSFSDGATPIAGCQNVLVTPAGTVQCTPPTFLSVGTHVITAVYSGNASYNGSTGTVSQVVNKLATTTTITSDNPDPSAIGQAVTVNFTVAPPQPPVNFPTGTVVVTVSGGPETCTGTLLPGGSGSCTLTLTVPGPRTITATYSGDGNFNASSGTTPHNVSQGSTTTTITNSAALSSTPSSVGQAYAVNFTVAPAAPGAGTPTGTVTVSDGTGATCTGAIAANGTGTCQLTSTTPGNKTITASYPGDANFTGSVSAGVPHQVVIGISGNIRQYVAFGTNTNLAGVTVTLTVNGATAGTTTTDANGNYSFALPASGSNIVITPSGLGKTYEPISRSYNNVTTSITNADFVAYDANGPNSNPREVKVQNTVGSAGSPVTVPVTINSQGNETSVSFTLAFDPALLGVPTSVTCGSGNVGCTAVLNNSTPGRVGVTITRAVPLAAGIQQIALITFPTFATTAGSAQITFADAPTARDTRDAGGNPLPTLYTGGFVSFTPDLEGDVVKADGTAPGGDGVLSNDVTVVRRMALGLIQPTAAQYRNADSAPRTTLGDGCPINSADVTQASRYNLGLDPPTAAGGPTAPIPGGCQAPNTRPEGEDGADRTDAVGRIVRAVNTSATAGQQVTVPFQLDSQGDESSLSFTVNFDPTRLTYVSAALGNGTPTGTNLALNTAQVAQGRLGVLLDATNTYAAGTRQILTVTFAATGNPTSFTTPVTFSSVPTPQSTSNANGVLLTTTYETGNVTATTTAAGVSISGRVTSANGQGLRNATVTITDAGGNRRTATTGSFGIYMFEDVEAGQSYVVGVNSKRFRFGPRVVNVSDSLANLDFSAME